VFSQIAVFFSKMAMVTFGGAYAVLAYVAQQAVDNFHWLRSGEMLDGLGMAETTPGPLVIVLQFVGFLAAYRDPGSLPPLVAGALGGLLTTWVTFVPCFLWIFLGAPFVEKIRGNKALAGALTAITAAVVGVILNLAIWFALHALFRETIPVRGFGLSFEVPALSSVDATALLLAVAAAFALFRLNLGVPRTLAVCTGAGVLLFLIGASPAAAQTLIHRGDRRLHHADASMREEPGKTTSTAMRVKARLCMGTRGRHLSIIQGRLNMTHEFDRRHFIGAAATAGAALAVNTARAEDKAAPTRKSAVHVAAPMPFDPKSVKGLSEKILVSHYENNYGGAVKRLNAIGEQLAGLDFDKAPGFQINGLKREELIATNSMILHEVYFAGLGEANKPGAPLSEAIERDFGSFDRWRSEFAGMGKALGGGSGWVILAYDKHGKRLINSWASDHTQNIAGGDPVLVLDMFEHAYQMDYGAKAGDYVKAVMAAINWSNADRLFAKYGKG
jgi:Fe-Mn family superoxide dismutase